MSKVVLDSSAVIAALNKEPGADKVLSSLSEATISAVNFAEVVSKLGQSGGDIAQILSDLQELLPDIRPFDANHALAAGLLYSPTRDLGLTFAGRACLGLAISLGVPVITADPAWAKLNIGVAIEVIRNTPSPKASLQQAG
jgi:PIN domain nuclease of toxin-antitoxin system